MIQFFRGLALLLLIAVGIMDTRYFHFALSKEWQVIIAVAILITLVFMDVITAFIFALVLATIYVKLYDVKVPFVAPKSSYDESLLDMITPENLREAQTNVVSEKEFDKEYKGIEGVYGEAVYGAQGLDETAPGLDRHALYGEDDE